MLHETPLGSRLRGFVRVRTVSVFVAIQKHRCSLLIPSLLDQNRCAQSRNPMYLMRQGWSVRAKNGANGQSASRRTSVTSGAPALSLRMSTRWVAATLLVRLEHGEQGPFLLHDLRRTSHSCCSKRPNLQSIFRMCIASVETVATPKAFDTAAGPELNVRRPVVLCSRVTPLGSGNRR